MPYAMAARGADLATVRTLWRLGYPWGPRGAAFARAITEGHCSHTVPVLRLMLALGCPVDWEAAERAAAGRDARGVRLFVQRRGCEPGRGAAGVGVGGDVGGDVGVGAGEPSWLAAWQPFGA